MCSPPPPGILAALEENVGSCARKLFQSVIPARTRAFCEWRLSAKNPQQPASVGIRVVLLPLNTAEETKRLAFLVPLTANPEKGARGRGT